MESVVYLLLGSNDGDRHENLRQAIKMLHETAGKVVCKSSVYETDAWGISDQPAFLNQVIEIKCTHAPEALLALTASIENALGRTRTIRWGQRIIDIDILFINNLIFSSSTLTIPHPGIPERRFTLVPLCEIAPDFVHPQLEKKMRDLLAACTDTLRVRKVL